jgi:SAM-dependent methyltransferase
VTIVASGWSEVEALVQPSRRATAVPRPGADPARPAILDFEPDRPVSFYDVNPYDYSGLAEWQSSPMLRELAASIDGGVRLDAGCGAGRNLVCIVDGAQQVVAVDLSLVSASRAAARFGVPAARASVLALPFVDDAFDLVVCDGVAHHTPDPRGALAEVVRVTRPGGSIYAALYRAGTRYSRIYRWFGGGLRLARRFEERGVPPVVDRLAFSAYRLASRLLKPGRTDPASLRAIYEDYFQTPIASFHSRAWMEDTFAELGAPIVAMEPQGNVWRTVARKLR